MGSQASKVGRQGDRVQLQPKLIHILSRKLDAIKRRRSRPGVSKEMLPKHGSEDGSSTVWSREADDDIVGSAETAPESIELVASDNDVREDDGKLTDNEALAMEKLALEEKDHKMVEEIERLKKEQPASLLCPRSPSFKFYLTDIEKEEDYSRTGKQDKDGRKKRDEIYKGDTYGMTCKEHSQS
ncbi:hypothetical protein V6N13_096468 [Hibiscus sabdariffa]|uniref:Uncharacterized protein n=1 Tax=Hibiscus sabdariffa TaxID=183260 RepID=A0ABR1ZH20_9ROSI